MRRRISTRARSGKLEREARERDEKMAPADFPNRAALHASIYRLQSRFVSAIHLGPEVAAEHNGRISARIRELTAELTRRPL